MLRPERMSRVSVTGAKPVMDDVIQTVHDLRLLHITEYDGSWDGFDPGSPIEGADQDSDLLVTVRALESILDVEEEDAGPTRLIDEETVETELEEIRQNVNELDDRRNDLQDELREIGERIEQLEPFVTLGIDLDLLTGYDRLSVAVGTGDPESVERVLADGGVDEYEVFAEDDVAAVVARADEATLQDTLVNARFTAVEVPDPDGFVDDGRVVDPSGFVEELEHRRQQVESRLGTVEEELDELRLDVGGFLLAVEEQLSIQVQKEEAPLSFATTENAFVAEGWIPTERYDEFARALTDAVGDHVEIQELERAEYDADGHVTDHGEVHDESGTPADRSPAGGESGAAAASADTGPDEDRTGESDEVAADGGVVTTGRDEPPVVMDNPSAAGPFEMLVETVERPRYGEFDPTVILWLTFPAFYGFMIGDVAYGLLYTAMGYVLWSRFESDAVRSLGGIAMWAGGFTILFGVLYGEFLGLHFVGDWYGGAVIKKGIQPVNGAYARAWLLVATMVGLGHMTLGYVLDFAKNRADGLGAAFLESGSWAMLFVGIWVWIFSRAGRASKPEFIYRVLNDEGLALGFAMLPASIGQLGLLVGLVGLLGVAYDEAAHEGVVAGIIIALLEGLVGALANVLSYTRLTAVLLAKAGMALVVNLLFFGAYQTGEGDQAAYHFGTGHMPHAGDVVHGQQVTEIMFPGLIHMGLVAAVLGVLVFVVGHLIVLALGVTSAGLQAVRLEFVEFMTKFYEGGGDRYEPFGYLRKFTTQD